MMRFVLALLNLLGFPGIGTYLAGHKRTGVAQILIHMIAMILTLGGFAVIAPKLLPIFRDRDAFLNYVEQGPTGGYGPLVIPLAIASIGSILFLINWLWSATTTKPANGKTPPPLPNELRH